MPAILGHNLLYGVPSMVEGLRFMVVDDRVGARGEMLVFVEPNVNVVPKCCAHFLRAMDHIRARDLITHKLSGSIVDFLINKSVEPNEEPKV
mgnify:CR=1 FL=1